MRVLGRCGASLFWCCLSLLLFGPPIDGALGQDLDDFVGLFICDTGTVNDICVISDTSLPPLPDSIIIRGSGSLVVESGVDVECVPIPDDDQDLYGLAGICHLTFDFAGNITIRGQLSAPFVSIRAMNVILEDGGRITTSGFGWGTTFVGWVPAGVTDGGPEQGEEPSASVVNDAGECAGGGGGGHAGGGGDGCGDGTDWPGGSGIPPAQYDEPSWPLQRGSRGGRGLKDEGGLGTSFCLPIFQPTCEPGAGGGSVRVEVMEEMHISSGSGIYSNGVSGESCDAAGAGGGAGGSIAIDAATLSGTGVLQARGGDGGSGAQGAGGGGGGGYVSLRRPNDTAPFGGDIDVSGGSGASTSSNGCSSDAGDDGEVFFGPRRVVTLQAGGTTIQLRFSPTFSIRPTIDEGGGGGGEASRGSDARGDGVARELGGVEHQHEEQNYQHKQNLQKDQQQGHKQHMHQQHTLQHQHKHRDVSMIRCHVTPSRIVESGGVVPSHTFSSQPLFRVALEDALDVSFLGDMSNSALISSTAALYDADSSVSFGPREVPLKAGDFKTDITIDRWTWGSPALQRTLTLHYTIECDEGIDSVETLRGSDEVVVVVSPSNVDWRLSIELLELIGIDGSFPTGSVFVDELEEDGQTSIEMRVVLPRFNETGSWDPTFNVLLAGEEPDEPSADGGGGDGGGDGGGKGDSAASTAAIAGTIGPLAVLAVCCCLVVVCCVVAIAMALTGVSTVIAGWKRKAIISRLGGTRGLADAMTELEAHPL